MAIYVDVLRNYGWRYGRSCHMWADGGQRELHHFAYRLGLPRRWFQWRRNGLPHYDLTVPRRRRALELGAIELTMRQAVGEWHVLRNLGYFTHQEGDMDLFTKSEALVVGDYRYWLRRTWSDKGGTCGFVMLNPSTADHQADDPTIRKCMGFARQWGHGSLLVLNLFNFRSTDPDKLVDVADPVGASAALYLTLVNKCDRVVVGWGTKGGLQDRDLEVLERIKEISGHLPECLGTTKDGFPCHPLYLPYTTPLIDYQGRS